MGGETRKPRREAMLLTAAIGLVLSAIGIVIGLWIDWFPIQGSTQAEDIDTLWDVLVICSVPVFVGVTAVVLFSAREFRQKPGEEHLDGPPIHGNTKLEIVWTAIPAVMLIALCGYAAVVLSNIEEAPASGQEDRVAVTGEQFTWTFEYTAPDGKKFSTNQLYVEQGKSVKFDVRSKDVIHDFWVPQWRLKIDAVPGVTTGYRVTPTRTGVYPVVCAELCGLGHAFMRQSAHVLTPARFDKWMTDMAAKKAAGAAPAAGGTAAAGGETAAVDGKALFTDGNGDATACGACHTLADAGTEAATGPNLDEVLAGQDAAAIKTSIIDPNAEISEGFGEGIMPPNYGETLTPAEIDALVKYIADATKK